MSTITPSTILPASFDALSLHSTLRRVLAEEMGITQPTPIQARAIPELLAGHDVMGQARTGSGKTLAFALPLVERCDPLVRGVQALVLVPTRELAVQVGGVLGKLAGARRLRLTHLYGGRSFEPERRALRDAQIIVGTPGRTLDHLRQESVSLRGLRVLVLDEADEMLDRGFAPDVERILRFAPERGKRQTALFSATMPTWVATTAAKHLLNPVNVAVDPSDTGNAAPPSEIEHVIYDMHPDFKLNALRSLLDEREARGDEAGSIIVFGRTKHGVKKLAKRLEDLGYQAAALQGNLSQNARERVIRDFRSGTVPILLATNVAARGLDVDHVERVINYELPESAELFTHRVGRTGRMGRRGEAITFLTPDDADKWRQIEKALGRKLPRTPWGGNGGVAPAPGSALSTPSPTAAPAARAAVQQPRRSVAPSQSRTAVGYSNPNPGRTPERGSTVDGAPRPSRNDNRRRRWQGGGARPPFGGAGRGRAA